MQSVLIAFIGLVVTYSSNNETVKRILAVVQDHLMRLGDWIAPLLPKLW